MKIIRTGVTRLVILIGNHAIKIPRLDYGWRLFLTGLLCNMREVEMWTMKDKRLCPVVWNIAGGWLLIMPKCRPCTKKEFEDFDYSSSMKRYNQDDIEYCCLKGSVENKLDSFGWLDGRIVALDYGS